ncbi:MAG TPA: 4Fe-4S dicluster domain-containing protein [Phycisphaerae bacterium]|nr:4Fe-4S dicluster domain-containing protein [Phycisphaerae bacterium]
MEKKILKKQSLGALFDAIKAGGRRLLGPVEKDGRTTYEEVSSPAELAKDYIQTTTSAKSVVFPACEEIVRWQNEGHDVKVADLKPQTTPTVVFGVRPCDAASFAILDSVFSWDYNDEFFRRRLENTTIIGLACTKSDEYCFCTSVELNPGDTRGSDLLLTPIDGEQYLVEIVTDKGKKLVDAAAKLFTPAGNESKEKVLAKVPVKFDQKKLTAKLPALFPKENAWVDQSLACLGCGACAFVCPACVCFDIQDESGRNGGTRLRCWDSCGFSLFTLHTSGHNPRPVQSQRWRQRIMHKFSYFPERLSHLGCVGCGRCSRACPADMNLVEHLSALVEAADGQ